MNAGEVPVSRKGAARLSALTLLAFVCRVRGGGGLWVGAGVPSSRPGLVLAYKAAASACAFVRWREEGSESIVSSRGTSPDWAFALGSNISDWLPPDSRKELAVVLRGDRQMPSPEWIAWIQCLINTTGLHATLVVQVKRDEARAAHLAALLGADVLAWNHEDHAAQEDAVRSLYSRCRLVVGDRLHGLIVAATEGAVPLGWVESSKGKVGRHFHVVGLDWVGEHEGVPAAALPIPTLEELDRLAKQLAGAVQTARENLAETSNGIRQTLPANTRASSKI
ncbi:polysaccharide pyruvyl transferase family protein [Paenarthrobacter sp. YIM B13468]|uniref:polysaccharide pyruvyl transferase family protein n=1 Tax=Paenarthrobacter sp. YIM B13468 TaxID=3366295 RepID=UPI0036730752